MDNRPLAVQQQAAREMQQRLDSIPHARGFIVFHEALIAELGALEKIVWKLKSFVEFLAQLNPARYLRWMQEAFANYVASPPATRVEASPVSPPTPPSTWDRQYSDGAAPSQDKPPKPAKG